MPFLVQEPAQLKRTAWHWYHVRRACQGFNLATWSGTHGKFELRFPDIPIDRWMKYYSLPTQMIYIAVSSVPVLMHHFMYEEKLLEYHHFRKPPQRFVIWRSGRAVGRWSKTVDRELNLNHWYSRDHLRHRLYIQMTCGSLYNTRGYRLSVPFYAPSVWANGYGSAGCRGDYSYW